MTDYNNGKHKALLAHYRCKVLARLCKKQRLYGVLTVIYSPGEEASTETSYKSNVADVLDSVLHLQLDDCSHQYLRRLVSHARLETDVKLLTVMGASTFEKRSAIS